MIKIFYKNFPVILLLFVSCKPGPGPQPASPGEADFSNYIAIGNSLTAGYADNSLYRSGQENAFPAMLATQLKWVGGGEFKQPLLTGNSGYPDRKLVLGYVTDCRGENKLSPVPYSGPSDMEGSGKNIADQGPFNNLGIPGIRCVDLLLPGYPALNPYSKRFFPPGAQTIMDLIASSKPTFFSLWLGNNDVLGYATNGGEGNISGLGLTDISPVDLFKTSYAMLVDTLIKKNAKGILINIPDITSIAYFNTIQPKGLHLSEDEAQDLSRYYDGLDILFTAGNNYFVIQDQQAPGGVRQIKENEFLLLKFPQDSLTCGGWGRTKPIPKAFVLSEDEVNNVQTAISDFNRFIAEQAAKHNLALLDANAFLKTLQSGMVWDGIHYSPGFLSGGIFSLDGVHLTPRGNALVTNEIIKTINAHYKSTIPPVENNKFDGIKFP